MRQIDRNNLKVKPIGMRKLPEFVKLVNRRMFKFNKTLNFIALKQEREGLK